MYGAIAGLSLGLLEGVVLPVVTLLFRWQGTFKGVNRYCRTAGWACAAACVIALALFFELTARGSGTSFVSEPAYDSDDAVFLLIMMVGPSLVAAGAAWWAGRRVAEQYTNEFGEPVSHGPTQAAGETLVEETRRR